MMTPKITSLILLGMLMLVSVNTGAASIPQATENPFCSAAGTFELGVSSPTIEQYDVAGKFFNLTIHDAVDIFVKFGNVDDSESPIDFKFHVYNSEYQNVKTLDCEDTGHMTFVALFQGAMVLKDEETSKYYSCVFLPSYLTSNKVTPIARAELAMPTAIATPTIFVPIFFNDDRRKISIVVGDATKANVYYYMTHPSFSEPTTGTTVVAAEAWRNNFLGTSFCFFDVDAPLVKCIRGNAWYPLSALIPLTTTNAVTFMPLYRDFFAVLKLDDGEGLSGHFYLFNPNTWEANTDFFDDFDLTTSSRAYGSYTDQLYNVIVYNDGFFYWFNLKGGFAPRSIYIEGDDFDTDPETLITAALSGNKLAILYADRMEYYRMIDASTPGEANIEKLFTKEYSEADVGASGSFLFGLECVCEPFLRFSCYSSTLNCLLIKKVAEVCGKRDLPPSGP